jgi:hypothetical protein
MKRATPNLIVLVIVSVVAAGSTGCADAASIRTLASFDFNPTGSLVSGVAVDGQGTRFGATDNGGTYYAGAVYELAAGSHTITPLAYFGAPEPTNSFNAYGSVALDSHGNLYGTTDYGGDNGGSGTVYEVAGVAAASVSEPSTVILAAPALVVLAIIAARRRKR